MISPSRKLFYVVEAVVAIAYNAGQGATSSREIAQRQGLPPRYLEQLMQRLVKGGLLRGVRGPNGGYVLAKERRRITVADIYKTLGEEKEDDHKGYKATTLGKFVVQPVWDALDNTMMQHLKKINLAELCEQAAAKQIQKNTDEKSVTKTDFTI
ncbi:MAG: Rrf2 family transcriptional regulator [Rickettsiales bacterium]|jgi:Rrf2 family iron-sulfur cluster assembly transcriptional regulator